MEPRSRIYVAGGSTLMGQALVQRLLGTGYKHVLGVGAEPDLTCPTQVRDFFAEYRPEYVFLAAGASGGIRANQERPAELMLDNLLTSAHVIHQAYYHGVRRLLYLTSSCIYPRAAKQPMHPSSLLTGPLEPTNEAYAVAKISGWKLCEAYRREYGVEFRVAILANAFGPGDDFSCENSHIIPGLMRRMHQARAQRGDVVTIWGTGKPVREFGYAPDLAAACVYVVKHDDYHEPINIGGQVLSIADVAAMIADVVGYKGRLRYDPGLPDGMARKTLDCRPCNERDFRPKTDFRTALEKTYAWFVENLRPEATDDRVIVFRPPAHSPT